MLMLDPEGGVASWNSGAERIKGYRSEEIVGHSFSIFFVDDEVRSGRPAEILRMAAETGHFEEQGWAGEEGWRPLLGGRRHRRPPRRDREAARLLEGDPRHHRVQSGERTGCRRSSRSRRFDTGVPKAGGQGLPNLRERAAALRGSMELEATQDRARRCASGCPCDSRGSLTKRVERPFCLPRATGYRRHK